MLALDGKLPHNGSGQSHIFRFREAKLTDWYWWVLVRAW